MGFTRRHGPKRRSPAGCFLWIVAVLIVLVLAGALAYRLFERELMRARLGAERRLSAKCRCRPAPTMRRPACGSPGPTSPAIRRSGRRRASRRPTRPRVSVFFVHPTCFLERSAWNAPLDDRGFADRAPRCSSAARRARSTASARSGRRNTARRPSAPSSPARTDARQALDFAYRDVLAAFEAFLAPGARRTGRSSSPPTARAACI